MVSLTVNGEQRQFDGDPNTPLLWVLRDTIGLTGVKFGCGAAQCGCCTVYIDGLPSRSCVTAVAAVEGREIVTIEGVAGLEADAVRHAWRRLDVPQCGFCQAGQIMSAVALLKTTPEPSDEHIDTAMAGNICRCGTYQRIRQAIKDAAKTLEGQRNASQ